jgi:hypothetical protein
LLPSPVIPPIDPLSMERLGHRKCCIPHGQQEFVTSTQRLDILVLRQLLDEPEICTPVLNRGEAECCIVEVVREVIPNSTN